MGLRLISLYRKYSFVDYQHHLCSFASLVTFVALLFAVIVPIVCILTLNNSQNYFIVFEQPVVKFQYKYLVVSENSLESDDRRAIMCSSFEQLNQFNETEKCSKIRVSEKDKNYDGVSDEITFNVEFSTFHDYGIKFTSIVLYLDARLNDQCDLRIPTAVILNKKFSNNFNNRRIQINGRLDVEQNLALACPYFLRNIKSHFFFEKLHENQTRLEEFQVLAIQKRLSHNPMYFRFHELFESSDLNVDNTIISIRLQIPEIPVRYQKTFWQKTIDFWIQFLSIFIITFTIVNLLLSHLFENRWIMSRRKNYVKDKEF